MKFLGTIKIREGNPYILISKEQSVKLKSGWKKPLPVLTQINGKPGSQWKINMMPVDDGSFYLYLHGDVRKASHTKVGDKVDVDLSFDGEYRSGHMHAMPSWFSSALNKNSTAKKNWELLIPSRKKEILRYLSWLKTGEARKRNLERAMSMLSGKSGRYMAHSWKDGV